MGPRPVPGLEGLVGEQPLAEIDQAIDCAEAVGLPAQLGCVIDQSVL